MSDPNSSAATDASNAGSAASLAQIAATMMAAATSLSETVTKLASTVASISENVSKVSSTAGTDSNFEANVVGVSDPYDGVRRSADHYAQLQQASYMALMNAVGTADMVAKQAVRHSDIAIDRQWNGDAALAAAVADQLATITPTATTKSA
jgi:hypothetical protein